MPIHRVYVYGEQQVAAQSLLDQCNMFPGGRLQRVSTRHHIAGLDRGTFVVVANHARPVPADIMQQVELIGMLVFELDDKFARAMSEGSYVAPETDAA